MFIPTAGFRVEGIGPWQYLITQFGVISWYLRLFLLPVGQVFDYGWPFAESFWRAEVLLPLAFLLAVVAAAVWAFPRYRLATFCIAWVFVTLAPTSSLLPLKDAAFEHRMYLPVIGLAWLLVVGGHDLLTALAPRTGRAPAALRRAGAMALGAWLALLGLATVHRNTVFADAPVRAGQRQQGAGALARPVPARRDPGAARPAGRGHRRLRGVGASQPQPGIAARRPGRRLPQGQAL
ncbi:MAG: hypothetical protein U0802_08040 [Candidatus Binatia bacterium]